MRLAGVVFCLLLVAALLGGCGEGGGTGSSLDHQTASARPQLATPSPEGAVAVGRSIKYEGWDALELSNQIVRLVCVPGIGGRLIEFSLDGENAFWVNHEELGKLYPPPTSEAERVWHNYGGSKTWPSPQDRWGGPPDPLGSLLDGGIHQGKLLRERGPVASLEAVSPSDEAVTGVRFYREAQLFAGEAHVRFIQRMENVSEAPVRWSIWDVTQVVAEEKPGKGPSGKCQLFVPAAADGKIFHMVGPEDGAQWLPEIAPGIIGVSYTGETGKIGVHSLAGWGAYHNGHTNLTYVKRFEVFPELEYPEQNSSVEVWTNPAPPSLMELEVLSPLVDLRPGEDYTFTQDWYLTRSEAPIIDTNEAGVLVKRLALEEKEGKLKVKGSYGVYRAATWELTALDGDAKPLASAKGECSPSKPFVLEATLETAQSGVTKLVLRLLDASGRAIGSLDELNL